MMARFKVQSPRFSGSGFLPFIRPLPVATDGTAPLAGAALWPKTDRNGCLRSRSEEHTSELQSQFHLVCRLLLEKKKKKKMNHSTTSSAQLFYLPMPTILRA